MCFFYLILLSRALNNSTVTLLLIFRSLFCLGYWSRLSTVRMPSPRNTWWSVSFRWGRKASMGFYIAFSTYFAFFSIFSVSAPLSFSFLSQFHFVLIVLNFLLVLLWNVFSLAKGFLFYVQRNPLRKTTQYIMEKGLIKSYYGNIQFIDP